MDAEMRAFKKYWGNRLAYAEDYVRWKDRQFSKDTITRFYGNWNNACDAVGLKVAKVDQYSDEEIIDLLLSLWRWREQRPTIEDLKKFNKEHNVRLHVKTIVNRWGSWKTMLHLISQLGRMQITKQQVIDAKIDRNPRESISVRLRSEVLKRDQYTCVDCGASPRKDPSVNLHIHHVIPVSKGGKSVIDNLVTNCDACNLGKSDKISSE
tara:strand:- start:584 stop:1210 length:627 start_codon:yes stop_codon:yes gene_type:complete